MSRIDVLREQINIQDDLIVKHIAERVRLANEIRFLKAQLNLPHPDRARELEVLDDVAKAASEFGLDGQHIKEVFETIIGLTKHEQEVYMKAKKED